MIEPLRKIPEGGVLKQTEGFVRQIFTEKGELVWQEFVPDGLITFFDEKMEELSLEGEDDRLDSYAPCDMVQPPLPNTDIYRSE